MRYVALVNLALAEEDGGRRAGGGKKSWHGV